ncbi:MAG: trehalose-phosphatase [Corynebacterium sp.]|uniref:trehalose-phosphatase n=1 Tax=Corynebacterium TaxID=1716 RepID=UPI0026474F04|nr:trehalose-phosphatase [Corynebacterium sp.]MDN5583105.1 trehalose-phosphatase [Corynebacterium sp.]MDN5720895.1 trehalose-phosphatase [Corynebacterium sp.]MDN6325727.1 trehalose-phosphatase [Corynebacterium sp.]MDN6387344.1 trehalose-phosphatase [Corynebacterium sp.]MDN6511462.1 trehalose-phosphatase [Corynebacterium sp.]
MTDATTLPAVSTDDIQYLAEVPHLLVALDFDGTLSGFSTDPLAVRMVPGARATIDRLAGCAGTTVMLLSGRNLEVLEPVAEATAIAHPGPGDILLVGSHGAEPADATSSGLDDDQRELLDTLSAMAQEYADRDAGMWVEHKPFAVGLHIRGASDERTGLTAYEEFRLAAQKLEGVTVTPGKSIVEVSVSPVTKGSYLSAFIDRTEPDAVVFAGDDVTDETALSVLDQQGLATDGDGVPARPDLGIRVGDGDTAAHRRLADPVAVADVLARLAEARLLRQGDRDGGVVDAASVAAVSELREDR